MDIKDVLKDTIEGCLCIISRGIPEGDYRLYKDGISRIRGHIFGRKFSGEIAGACACRVLYLAAAILIGQDFFKRIEDSTVYRERKPHFEKSRRFSYLQVVDPIAYGYLIEASLLLESLVLR